MQITNFGSLFLMSNVVGGIAIGVAAIAVIGIVLFFFKYQSDNKKIGSTKERIAKMLDEAEAQGKIIKKEAILEAKEQELKLRNEFERECKEKRSEIQRAENRIQQKEDHLSRRSDELAQEQHALQEKQKDLSKKMEDINKQHETMLVQLERVAQMSREDAKAELVETIKSDARKEAAVLVRNIENTAKEEADKKAKEIIGLAIQKCSTEQASELTISVVPLPNDDMKARIIGREGRNIRALETATGVELIIDDTPEVVIVSGFDPVRREVARVALEKLIGDGRIHPARIEETVEKVKKELDQQIKEAGESAMFECGLFGLHPEIIKTLGRLKFRTSYGQNVLKHSIEVSHLAGVMAAELGVDVTMAKRAGLLHDLGKAVDFEIEGTHMQIGADIAKKYKENASVINAILAHHGDVEPKTIEAILVQAADSVSGARPGARRETTTNYVKRLQKLEELASDFKGVDNCYAIQAGREIRVVVKPEQVSDADALFLAKDIAKKIEEELEYPGQIKVNVIRETRATEFAK